MISTRGMSPKKTTFLNPVFYFVVLSILKLKGLGVMIKEKKKINIFCVQEVNNISVWAPSD